MIGIIGWFQLKNKPRKINKQKRRKAESNANSELLIKQKQLIKVMQESSALSKRCKTLDQTIQHTLQNTAEKLAMDANATCKS